MLYHIVHISDLTGQPATDPDSLRRIDREGYIVQLHNGSPLMLNYAEPYVGLLCTSPVCRIGSAGRMLSVTTRSHVYHLRKVETYEPGSTIIDRK